MILGYSEKDNKYVIGSKILYECESNYQAYGATMLECQDEGYWSEYPPKCLPKGQNNTFKIVLVSNSVQYFLLKFLAF